MPKPWQNKSGCNDPTAYSATKQLSAEEKKKEELVFILRTIIRWSGFELTERIKLRGPSGKYYT